MDRKDFKINKAFPSKNKGGLGKLFEASVKDQQNVICRIISFNRVKEYVVEEFIREIISL